MTLCDRDPRDGVWRVVVRCRTEADVLPAGEEPPDGLAVTD